jgi:Zn-dependent protease with chaperone function
MMSLLPMRSVALLTVTLAVLLVVSAAAAAPYVPPRDEAFDRKVQAEIEARDPQGAELFARAGAALDRQDLTAAAGLLEDVHARDPWFVHATRRLCGVESWRGNHERAIALCRQAYGTDASVRNESALALALLMADKGTGDNGTKALDLASEAAHKDPQDYFAQSTFCQAALHMNVLGDVAWCASAMRHIAPHDVQALYYSAIVDGSHGKLDEASRELEEAHAGGLPDDAYRKLHEAIDGARSPVDRWGRVVLETLVGWLAGFALLLGVGALLSAAAMRAARRVPTEPTGHARGFDAWLRRTYRVVLWLTCAYYYASLPVVALLVVGMGAGAVYASLAMGVIPIKLLLVAFIITIGSVGAIGRSLVAGRKDEDPGEKLSLSDHPRLRAVLDEVAARIGTRPVDSVYVTPGTEIAVLERGGLLRQLRGKSERCLVLGAAVLEGMRVRELKAILAHEYGHFHNEDTAGGGFALAVRRSLLTMAMHLVRGRAASNLNPAWWFVKAFHAVFLRVSQGASRLQEVLADRWAAFAYGSEAFSRGLIHVVGRSVRFDAHIQATLGEVVPAKQPLANVYSYVPKEALDPKKVEEAIEEAMSRAASPYDSHPRPADRIAWMTQIAAAGPAESAEDIEDAWSLLSQREVIEKRMTDEVRARLAMRGIRVQAAG